MDLFVGKNLTGLGLLQRLIPAEQVNRGFTGLDQAGLPVRQPEYRRAAGPIVVTGHAELIGPTDRDGDQIAGFEPGEG
jgi:hypothetical protein